MTDIRYGDSTQDQLSTISRLFDGGTLSEMRHQLRSLSPSEIAELLTAAPPKLRQVIWDLAQMDERVAQILQQLSDDVRSSFLLGMNAVELAAAANDIDTDDFTDILQQLPDTIASEVLGFVDAQNRRLLEQALAYPEDSAGGLMNSDMITVRPMNRLDLVLRYLRRHKRLPDTTDALFVVNSRDEFIGLLPLARLLTSDPRVTVREVMDTDIEALPHHCRAEEVARIFTRDDLVSAPVVDDQGRLVGRITIDDVVDVVIEEADQSLTGLSRVDIEDDTFAPLLKSLKARSVWLGINLFTAVLATIVIQRFEETIVKVVALAVLMPIVASMSGIAGTQVLTLVVRGQALGHIGPANLGWLARREILNGLFNGLIWAMVVALGAGLVFRDILLAATIAIAIAVSIVIAVTTGVFLPGILRLLRVDPAVAGVVVLTTVTDVVGFASFLGLATLLYGI